MSTRGEPTLFDGMEQYIRDEAFECLLRDNETYKREVQRRQKEGEALVGQLLIYY